MSDNIFSELNLPPISIPTTDAAAQKEDDLFGKGKKKALHNIFIVFIYVAFAIFIVVLICRVLHFVLPKCRHWLDDEQLQGIDKLIFSGAIGGFIGRFFKGSN